MLKNIKIKSSIPKFDNTECDSINLMFMGHYEEFYGRNNCDVYISGKDGPQTFFIRFSNRAPDYETNYISNFKKHIQSQTNFLTLQQNRF